MPSFSLSHIMQMNISNQFKYLFNVVGSWNLL